jgi:MFS family permease
MIQDDQPLRPLSQTQTFLIGLGMVAMGIGFTINFVVVTPLARQAGLSELQVAGMLTLSAIFYALTTPFWGRIAQRYGRRNVMAFSLIAMAATNLMFLLSLKAALAGVITGLSGFLFLAFIRVWFGLLSPGLQPAAMAAVADATTPATRAAGLGGLSAGMSLGSILGPAATALLAPFGALMPLWASIGFSALCGVLIFTLLPKDEPGGTANARPKPLTLADPRIRPHVLFLLAYFTGVGMIQQTVSWFIEDRYRFVDTPTRTAAETAVAATGIVFACMAIAILIVQFGYIARYKPNPRRVLPLGLLLVGVGYFLTDAFHPFWLMCLSYGVIGIGAAFAVSSANALGSLSVPRDQQGAAAALMASAPPTGFIFGPLIGAGLYQIGPELPFAVAGVLMVGLAVYAWRLKQPSVAAS